MNIGQAAMSAGISAKRTRYYEQIGLIDAAMRSDAAEEHAHSSHEHDG